MNLLPGWMPGLVMAAEAPFPSVMGQATTSDNSINGTMDVNLPSGIVAGELLLIGANFPLATASGWTTEVSTVLGSILWKIASGSEGSTVTLTDGSGTSHGAAVAYRIKGGKDLEVSTQATATSTSPDPGSLSPSWGSKKTLWFAFMTANGVTSNINVSAYPSGFTNQQTAQGVTGFPIALRVAMAERQEKAASMDPSAFTISSNQWAAYTIGIKP